MHQNMFLTIPEVEKILVVWKYAQMHKNTFLATPDV
jgi:folate-dependent tRNA-U54 methylase TrmFO/GidA